MKHQNIIGLLPLTNNSLKIIKIVEAGLVISENGLLGTQRSLSKI